MRSITKPITGSLAALVIAATSVPLGATSCTNEEMERGAIGAAGGAIVGGLLGGGNSAAAGAVIGGLAGAGTARHRSSDYRRGYHGGYGYGYYPPPPPPSYYGYYRY